jgi:16S rRNA (uracil1498-N3)-methyltransferase
MDASITTPRLFVRAALQAGADVTATPAQAHHLGTVLRRAAGDAVRLFNGIDGEWLARVTVLRRDRCEVAIEARIRAQAPEPDLWLVFAPLKRDATDLVVEKATELGAAVLLPVLTERTNAARVNTARLAAIATGAAEQSERLMVPRIAEPERLPSLLAAWPVGRVLVAALERREAPPVRPRAGPGALLVGPEGGFTPAELDLLHRHAFVEPVSLGPRVLRADTAAIVGLALLQAPVGGRGR